VPDRNDNRERSASPAAGGGSAVLGDQLDSEEIRILRQSLPAEAVTRDFLQELLEEHRAGAGRSAS
jgi:hypothetical protein